MTMSNLCNTDMLSSPGSASCFLICLRLISFSTFFPLFSLGKNSCALPGKKEKYSSPVPNVNDQRISIMEYPAKHFVKKSWTLVYKWLV